MKSSPQENRERIHFDSQSCGWHHTSHHLSGSGWVRKKTSNVRRWREGDMIVRWLAGAFLPTERNFGKIMGYHDLRALAGILGRPNIAAGSLKDKVA